MNRGFRLVIGVWAVAVASRGLAQQWDPRDPAPWHVQRSTKLPYGHLANAQAENGHQPQTRYLHIFLTLRPRLADPRFHAFRLTDRQGQTVAEVYGFDPRRAVLVFEGDWQELSGLYLDGLGHREPLEGSLATVTASQSLPDAGNPLASVRSTQPNSRGTNGFGAGMAGASKGDGSGAFSGLGGLASGSANPAESAKEQPGEVTSGGGNKPSNLPNPAASPSDRRLSQEARSRGRLHSGSSAGGAGGRKAWPTSSEVEPPQRLAAKLVFYLSCRGPRDTGTIYQVDQTGQILGAVGLPDAATGLALAGQQGLVAAIPPHRGKVVRIDPSGRVEVLLENDPLVVHPVDVATGPNSDTLMLADNVANLLATSSLQGAKAQLDRRLGPPASEGWFISLAVTKDHHVLLGTDLKPGVYRLTDSDQGLAGPVLGQAGGVAADRLSPKWAAAQPPHEICVYEDARLVTRYRVPSGQKLYRRGLLSFAPQSSVVTVVESEEGGSDRPWLVQFGPQGDSVRPLFRWEKEPIEDFVVGPRMPWEPYAPTQFRSRY